MVGLAVWIVLPWRHRVGPVQNSVAWPLQPKSTVFPGGVGCRFLQPALEQEHEGQSAHGVRAMWLLKLLGRVDHALSCEICRPGWTKEPGQCW